MCREPCRHDNVTLFLLIVLNKVKMVTLPPEPYPQNHHIIYHACRRSTNLVENSSLGDWEEDGRI